MTPTNIASSAVEQGSSEPELLQSRQGIKTSCGSTLIGLALLYAIAIWIDMRRFVWFDEIFTLDIARAEQLVPALAHVAEV